MAKELESKDMAESSSCRSKSKLWTGIWALDVPNAWKNFTWRCCHNLLPTKANLVKKKIIMEPECPICNLVPETPLHILWECPSAVDVWGASQMIFQKACSMETDFFNLAENLFLRCKKEEFRVFVAISRKLWFRRNSMIHEGKFSHPNEVVREAMGAIDDLDRLHKKEATHLVECGPVSPKTWTTPLENWIKINCDAALDKNRGVFGMGIVVRNSDGRLLAAKRVTRRGRVDPVVAEGMAFYYGVNLCKARGFQNVWLEGDSKLICDALNNKSSINSRYGHLIEDIGVVLFSFNQWKCTHIYREGNEAAHNLAREALNWSGERSWEDSCPDCIKQVISTEQIALV
jgi:ribonuclease HI